jgi:hypothetical protein
MVVAQAVTIPLALHVLQLHLQGMRLLILGVVVAQAVTILQGMPA